MSGKRFDEMGRDYERPDVPPPDDYDTGDAACGFANGLVLSAILWGVLLWAIFG
jgi:hypothetical protein